VLPVYFAYVVNAANVAMRNLTRRPYFPVKARERRAIGRKCFGQKLQSDGLAQFEIICAIDFAHAAASQETDDAIASGERSAGREPRVVNRIKRGGGTRGIDIRFAPRRAAFGGYVTAFIRE
jgi:hypothetical protein